MTTPSQQTPPEKRHGRHGHWMMIVCCVPMLAIVVALVATGIVGSGFLMVAVLCIGMMALMMVGMRGDNSRKD